jgi:hypothetical protein
MSISMVAQAKSNVLTGDRVVTVLSEDGKNYVGSVEKEYWDQAMTFIVKGNMEAIQDMLDSNKIFLVPKGLKGSVLDQSIFGGYAKVMVTGQDFTFFVSRDALKKR